MKNKRIVLVVFVVIVAISLVYALSDHREVTTSSEQAYQAYLRGKDDMYRLYTREATYEFEQAVKLDPNFAMAHARLAFLYFESDRKNDYEREKAKALSLIGNVRDKEQIVINLGFARADNKMADVDKYSKQLLTKYPNSFEAHDFLASQSVAERDWDKAIDENLKILKSDPNHAMSYNMLGYSYFYKGEYDKALEYIDKYSSIAQDQANPRDSHGELLLDLGRYDEALVQFQKADSIKPGLYFVISHMADTYRAKGMFRDAIGAYLKARDLGMSEKFKIATDGNIALCYVLMGQLDKAVDILAETLSKAPQDMNLHAILGVVYAMQGKVEDALVELGTVKGIAAKYAQTNPLTLQDSLGIDRGLNLINGFIAMAKGDYPTAIGMFKKTIEGVNLPDRMLYTSFLGDAYVKAEMPDSAVAVLNDALKDNPNCATCLKVLADAYRESGQKDAERGALLRYLAVMKDADDGIPDLQEARADLARLDGKTL